jgi:hypothetical protein
MEHLLVDVPEIENAMLVNEGNLEHEVYIYRV